jgi:hypothetical protein
MRARGSRRRGRDTWRRSPRCRGVRKPVRLDRVRSTGGELSLPTLHRRTAFLSDLVMAPEPRRIIKHPDGIVGRRASGLLDRVGRVDAPLESRVKAERDHAVEPGPVRVLQLGPGPLVAPGPRARPGGMSRSHWMMVPSETPSETPGKPGIPGRSVPYSTKRAVSRADAGMPPPRSIEGSDGGILSRFAVGRAGSSLGRGACEGADFTVPHPDGVRAPGSSRFPGSSARGPGASPLASPAPSGRG